MTDLALVLRSYSMLQQNRYEADISRMITTSGRITIPLWKFMSFGDALSDELLVDYSIFLRNSPLTEGLRNLIDLTWDRNSSHAGKKFTFNLTASPDSIKKLLPTPSIDEAAIGIELQSPSLKRPRISKIESYSPATLARYSKLIEKKLMALLSEEIPSANVHLQHQVLRDVMLRLEKMIDGVDPETSNINNAIVANIKNLVMSLEKYGRNDREQIKFKENLATAISGTNSIMRLRNATGLSRRVIDHGKSMRTLFDTETAKAIVEEQSKINNERVAQSTEINCSNEDQSDEEDSENENGESDRDDEEVNTQQGVKKRSPNGEGKRLLTSKNRYRSFFSFKARKVRSDIITGEEVQRFCHESQWGGRIDTLKLSRQSVIIEQPRGGFEYEPIRSYQYTVQEMYCHFKDTEYGARQRNSNSGRNMFLRRFRELICPCMTRDTADQIVAEFKQCLKSWDDMRKKDNNIKKAISRCQFTECSYLKEGSPTAAMYTAASKSASNFLAYLLCPQINRDELAITISGDQQLDVQDSYRSKINVQISKNLALAKEKKNLLDEIFRASCAQKCELSIKCEFVRSSVLTISFTL